MYNSKTNVEFLHTTEQKNAVQTDVQSWNGIIRWLSLPFPEAFLIQNVIIKT